jgi:hypothetical protein
MILIKLLHIKSCKNAKPVSKFNKLFLHHNYTKFVQIVQNQYKNKKVVITSNVSVHINSVLHVHNNGHVIIYASTKYQKDKEFIIFYFLY